MNGTKIVYGTTWQTVSDFVLWVIRLKYATTSDTYKPRGTANTQGHSASQYVFVDAEMVYAPRRYRLL